MHVCARTRPLHSRVIVCISKLNFLSYLPSYFTQSSGAYEQQLPQSEERSQSKTISTHLIRFFDVKSRSCNKFGAHKE
jgi:hypothetical protein